MRCRGHCSDGRWILSPSLYAISDLHLDYAANREVLHQLPAHREDWLLLAGDVSHEEEHLELALRTLAPRFARVVWVPGNHDLWVTPGDGGSSPAKYARMVERCRAHGVLTPEDPYPTVELDGRPHVVVPLFLLYDYSFRPDHVSREQAVPWALEHNILCTDEQYMPPEPYASREAWCAERCAATEARLEALDPELPLVLVNHFPLRRDLVLIRIPRFILWCGTRRTEDWHTRFNVAAVVYGHLHVPTSLVRDGVPFEEVSLGYPQQWQRWPSGRSLLRRVVPGHDGRGASGE